MSGFIDNRKLEPGKFKIKVLEDSVSGGEPTALFIDGTHRLRSFIMEEATHTLGSFL